MVKIIMAPTISGPQTLLLIRYLELEIIEEL